MPSAKTSFDTEGHHLAGLALNAQAPLLHVPSLAKPEEGGIVGLLSRGLVVFDSGLDLRKCPVEGLASRAEEAGDHRRLLGGGIKRERERLDNEAFRRLVFTRHWILLRRWRGPLSKRL